MNKVLLGAILALFICISCAPKTMPPDSNPGPWLKKANALAEAGKHGEAVQAYDEALLLAPSHLPSLTGRAASHMLRGDYLRAEADYSRLMELVPGTIWHQAQRGLARSLYGAHEGAQQDFTAVLGVEPENDTARLNRGYSRLELGQYAGALEDFNAVLARSPERVVALYYKSRSLAALGRFADAARGYGRIFALEPVASAQGAESLLGEAAETLEGLVRQASEVVDKGRTLPVLDCVARHVMGKDTLACRKAMP